MTQPLLSILIPTIIGREDIFNKLILRLSDKLGLYHHPMFLENDFPYGLWGRYHGEFCELFYIRDNKEITIGEKREKLYQMANGLYSWQIDDDDDIAENAIELIIQSIKNNPEIPCITFEENCMMDGRYYKSNHSIKYPKWEGDGSIYLSDGFHFHRSPFYKDVIRTDIAKLVPFEHIRWNEDERWSHVIQPYLKDEIHIDKEIYFYQHQSSNPQERYGFDRDEASNH